MAETPDQRQPGCEPRAWDQQPALAGTGDDMITEFMVCRTRRDAKQWAADFDLPDDQTARLAAWIWGEKPAIGCTYSDHPLSQISDEDFWGIVEPVD